MDEAAYSLYNLAVMQLSVTSSRDESCSVVFETDVTPGTVTDVGGGIETDLDEIAGVFVIKILIAS